MSSATISLVLERIGHVAVDDPLRQPLDDRRLADAGLADQHRVVLGAPRQHLHHPADLLVPADHRVEFPLAGQVGEVAGEPLQRLVLLFRRLVGDAMRAPHLLERRTQLLGARARRLPRTAPRRRPLLLGERQQEVLGGDVGVAQLLGDLVRPLEHLRQRAIERRRRCSALLGGIGGDFRLDVVAELGNQYPGLGQQRRTIPSSWVSRAERRWASLTTGLPRWRACSRASRTASCAFTVRRSGRSIPGKMARDGPNRDCRSGRARIAGCKTPRGTPGVPHGRTRT